MSALAQITVNRESGVMLDSVRNKQDAEEKLRSGVSQ